ncbi:MAG: HD domain-containing phosphohydrolase [Candidatus Omnitrophota bacterium]
MVELHRGFDGFESLRPEGKTNKESQLSLSEGADDNAFLHEVKKSDMIKAEAIYESINNFIKPVMAKAAKGEESHIKGEEILGWTQEIYDCLKKLVPDDLVRLFFAHDEYKENYIFTHSINVCLLCLRIAMALNFSPERIRTLIIAALFHDIGMMKIPLNIWNKPEKLTREEYEEVSKHVIYGEEILRNIPGIEEEVSIVAGQYHEKMDGSGYPRHLEKDSIHYEARLISLIDSYETGTHTRLWKPRSLPDKAIQKILDEEASAFDPFYMKAMLQEISMFPVGSWVRISSGETGKVEYANKDKPMRPVVDIIYDRAKKRLDRVRVLDLSSQLLLYVEECVDPAEFHLT